jgi:hypothetical protein
MTANVGYTVERIVLDEATEAILATHMRRLSAQRRDQISKAGELVHEVLCAFPLRTLNSRERADRSWIVNVRTRGEAVSYWQVLWYL